MTVTAGETGDEGAPGFFRRNRMPRLIVGVVISLMQAVTQVQEQSLTFIPKLVVVAVVFVAALPWMLRAMVEFTVGMLQSLPQAAR